MRKGNLIGKVIKCIGWVVLVIGIIAGTWMLTATMETPTGGWLWNQETKTYSRLPETVPNPVIRAMGVYVIAGSFIGGITWLGFGEIINLLDKIYKKQ